MVDGDEVHAAGQTGREAQVVRKRGGDQRQAVELVRFVLLRLPDILAEFRVSRREEAVDRGKLFAGEFEVAVRYEIDQVAGMQDRFIAAAA